jgi:hypothetical protein
MDPVAWQHIHFLGWYMFYGNKNTVDLEKIVFVLERGSNHNPFKEFGEPIDINAYYKRVGFENF